MIRFSKTYEICLRGVSSCVPLLHIFMKLQTCSPVSFFCKSNAMIGPYVLTKFSQLVLTGPGKRLQALSNSASMAAVDLLFPIAFST